MSLKNYIVIARPDHWFKNIFMLPGVAIAALLSNTPFSHYVFTLLIGLISACLIASANYVINEWLDADFDKFHPVKKYRPSVVGNMKKSFVYTEYVILIIAGIGLASIISINFLATTIALLIMGFLYNVKPFRTKDKMFLDVLSESVNNPIRLMLGWYIVISHPFPPSSLLAGYWMGGAFLMAVKRYSEFRFIKSSNNEPGLYRRSFKFYSEKSLLISSFFYGMVSAFFLGVFLVKYRIELLFSLPLFALLFTWYIYIGMKPDSAAQNPERLFREKFFLSYIIFLVIVVSSLLFFDLPWLDLFLKGVFIE